MAVRKLGSKAEEDVTFMEQLMVQADHLVRLAEEYATAKKNADGICAVIVRQLSQMRQQAMMKNLGPVADQAGMLSVAAGRGSQTSRTRTMREGLAGFKVMLERTIKARVDEDQRHRAEEDRKRAAAAPRPQQASRPQPAGPQATGQQPTNPEKAKS